MGVIPGRGAAGSAFSSVMSSSCASGLETVNRAVTSVGNHHQVAGFIEEELHRVEGIIANYR